MKRAASPDQLHVSSESMKKSRREPVGLIVGSMFMSKALHH